MITTGYEKKKNNKEFHPREKGEKMDGDRMIITVPKCPLFRSFYMSTTGTFALQILIVSFGVYRNLAINLYDVSIEIAPNTTSFMIEK